MAKRVKASGNNPIRIKRNGLSFLMSGDLQPGAQITSRSCVICGPDKDCDCASVKFGSEEYFARINRAHGQ